MDASSFVPHLFVLSAAVSLAWVDWHLMFESSFLYVCCVPPLETVLCCAFPFVCASYL